MNRVFVLYCAVALITSLAWGQSDNQTTNGTRLRIAIPVREFSKFVEIEWDYVTGENNYTGFAIDVFRSVMNALPTPIPFEFVPFAKPDGTMNGTFDDMLKAVYAKDYDGAVGDISILFYRTQYVDFTMPFLESSITMLVRVKTTKAAGISLIEITDGIVIATFAICGIAVIVYIAISVAKLKPKRHPRPERIRSFLGSQLHTRMMMLGFFVVLIVLIAGYIASEASTNTSQSRNGTVNNLNQLIRMGSNVGYREGSFIVNLLIQKGIHQSKLKSLKSEDEMVDMLKKGTSEGGVDAIVANAPHLKVLQDQHCDSFTTVPTTNLHATGFGFAFQKGSEYVGDISNAILKTVDNGQLGKVQDRTIGSLEACQADTNVDAGSLFLPLKRLISGGVLAGILIITSLGFSLCESFQDPPPVPVQVQNPNPDAALVPNQAPVPVTTA